MLGVDEIEIDDTFLGLKRRSKYFTNIKEDRMIRDKQESYQKKDDKEHQSFFVIYLGLQREGKRY